MLNIVNVDLFTMDMIDNDKTITLRNHKGMHFEVIGMDCQGIMNAMVRNSLLGCAFGWTSDANRIKEFCNKF